MAEPETQNLIRTNGQYTALNVPAAAQSGGRSTRAYKVAGITLLACVLIAGQAMVAYFLLSQKGDIKALEEQGNDLKAQLAKGRSVSGPMRMQANALPMMMVESVDEDSTAAPGTELPLTACQLEAAGLKPVQVPGFKPGCDQRGLYLAQQCFAEQCWCVKPADGQQIPGTVRQGRAHCFKAVSAGSLSRVMSA